MKKSLVVFFVLLIAALSVMAVSADQDGNHTYCNVDAYGCWNTGEFGEKEYTMFWSEAARDAIMGSGSTAAIATNDGFGSEMNVLTYEKERTITLLNERADLVKAYNVKDADPADQTKIEEVVGKIDKELREDLDYVYDLPALKK